MVDHVAGSAPAPTDPWAGGNLHHDGLVLRPWTLDDVPVMVELFDTAEMDRWTPLAHPFDEAAARAYVEAAVAGRQHGLLQLAITIDGSTPLGEVLLFGTDEPGVCELAYAVGAEHRGQALATRSINGVLPVARADGYRSARLRIATDNEPSRATAHAAGFALTDDPLLRRERKGYVLHLATWRREL
ncbi:MAG TPA: GNAT family N-acetyltransferase [Motilibacteraceae bacterium]|nr:GNAT family N-acetyltransferase [Motilibacteraceae bacterium]